MCGGRSSGVRGFRASRRAVLPSVDRAPPPREQLSWNAALLAHGRLTLKILAALMPLLHQENSRGGNGSSENHPSWAELLGIDTPDHSEPAAAPKDNLRANECGDASEWRWEEPGSPEAAHSPRALVPPACFPTPYPRAFTSFSESAQPGAAWNEETSGHGITDLVASLKALAMPASSARPLQTSIQLRLSYDPLDKAVEHSWPIERASNSRNKDDSRILPRRASFCGVVSSGSGGEAVHWSGSLPARCSDPSGGFSPKVFLGGLPWDITEQALMHALRHFQPVKVEWPGRAGGRGGPRGYAYVTLEAERRVRALLAACRRRGPDWYYRIAHRNMRSKEVQVIPWALSDSHWVCGGSARLEPARTVFVGALHGMLSASALATIMNDLFAGVVYAGIDTDKNKYPIGSGRVTFNNVRSYVRAISAAYIDIRTDKFTKKVQVDPYLEDSMCSVCNLQQGPYFCREPTCFGYFCRACWSWRHAGEDHKPLTRSSRAEPAHRHDLAADNRYTHSEGTPSPPTSGTAGTSGASDLEAAAAADERDRWPLR